MLMAKRTGSDIPPIEGGTYQAVCYSVVDLGTQHSVFYGTDAQKIIITWEIPSIRIKIEKDGEKLDLPRAISRIYTNSLGRKANLYKDLIAWRGKPFTKEEFKGFDVHTILGANCLLQVINEEKDDKVYANVASVAKLMKDQQKLGSENELVQFSMAVDGPTNIPDKVPDWVVDIIKKSQEYLAVKGVQQSEELSQAINQETDATNDNNDDIPF